MDDIVLRGMAKWPDVPSVYGWLSLDRRGRWLIKGEPIGNPGIVAFIARNYERDAEGRWFFQNGPQRVFVTLEYTPLVFRLADDLASPARLLTQRGDEVAGLRGAWIDEAGMMLIETEHGVGIVHDRDVEALAQAIVDAAGAAPGEHALLAALERIERGASAGLRLRYAGREVPIEPIRASQVAERFGFVPRPQPETGEEACT